MHSADCYLQEHRRRKMILSTGGGGGGGGGGNTVGGHAPFYVKHKALANLNSYVHFLVEIHLQLFTTVIITTVFCTGALPP